jgi:hypothetical protein
MKKKQDIITFKVDEDLREALQHIPNRSSFIRSAIVAALGSVCPLCNGSGILTPNQKQHWDDFSANHMIERCEKCDERVLVCSNTRTFEGNPRH